MGLFKEKQKKVQITITLDEKNKILIEEVAKKFKLPFATTLNDILNYFKEDWENGIVEKKMEMENEK